MKQKINFFLVIIALFWAGCDIKEDIIVVDNNEVGQNNTQEVYDGNERMIVLGDKLENPYSIENMQKAYDDLTKAGVTKSSVEITVTDIYVRFLPKDSAEYLLLAEGFDLELFDRPLDKEIIGEGTYYHDPSIPEDQITWQYTTVSPDFKFPAVKYEVLAECFIPKGEYDEEDPWEDGEEPSSKGFTAEMSFLEALELKAIENSGIMDKLPVQSEPHTKGWFSRKKPQGTIKVYDDKLGGFVPVKGVKVRCNLIVKWVSAYTDDNGYYKMGSSFRFGPFYELIFSNHRGFDIWGNLGPLSAAELLMGFHSKSGHNRDLRSGSSWTWATINNAAADYYDMCSKTGISKPPRNLKIWHTSLFGSASSAPMLRRINCGVTFRSSSDWSNFLSNMFVRPISFALMTTFKGALPDITIGSGNTTSATIYQTTCHELAHASHYSQVGNEYWEKYISFIMTNGVYGEKTDVNAGVCGVGEMWGYAMGNIMREKKYGGTFNSNDNNWWFKPQIIYDLVVTYRILNEREIYNCMTSDIRSHEALRNKMINRSLPKAGNIMSTFYRHGF